MVALLLLSLVACDELDSDTSSDERDDGCPLGMVEARTAAVTITWFNLDGIDKFVGYDGDAELGGVPAACVSEEYNSARLVLSSGTEPIGVLQVAAEASGSLDLNGDTGGVTLNLSEIEDSPRFGPGDWQSGSAWVELSTGQLGFDVNGIAVADGHEVTVQLSGDVRR